MFKIDKTSLKDAIVDDNRFKIYDVLINNNTSLYDISIPNNINITINNDFNELKLDNNIKTRLIEMINKYIKQPNFDFDCLSFVHYYKNWAYLFGNYNDTKYNKTEFNKDNLKINDVIIFNNDNDNIHACIYLCNDLYVSKIGTSGPIVFTNFNEIKKAYNSTIYYKIDLIK